MGKRSPFFGAGGERVSEHLSPVQAGEVVAGKYRVERVLGAGGMGIVVMARHLDLDRPVALKFLLPKALGRPDFAARFSREARSAAKLQSEHVARVLDVGALADGAPYIVMEYLEGEDLGCMIARRGALPIDEAVGYVVEACEAIAEAHAQGITHRDLKPANLFLAQRPSRPAVIKVVDFGLSKVTGGGEEQVTSDSSMLGSPVYMSPEQLLSPRDVDWRADIWALGIVLYELLSGRSPFRTERMPELVADIMNAAPYPIESRRPDTPPALRGIIDRCLQKSPAARFGNVAELARELEPFCPTRTRGSIARVYRVLGDPTDSVRAAAAALAPADAPLPLAKTVSDAPPAKAVAESVSGSTQPIAITRPTPVISVAPAPIGARPVPLIRSVALAAGLVLIAVAARAVLSRAVPSQASQPARATLATPSANEVPKSDAPGAWVEPAASVGVAVVTRPPLEKPRPRLSDAPLAVVADGGAHTSIPHPVTSAASLSASAPPSTSAPPIHPAASGAAPPHPVPSGSPFDALSRLKVL